MFKLISFVLITAGLIWTWTLFNADSKTSTQVHAEIQSKLALLIEETIKSKKPDSSNFELKQMYTSAINEYLVSAHFSYKFQDKMPGADAEAPDSVEQSISGYALLARTPSENPEIQKWVIQSIKTNQETVSFSEGMVVTAGGDASTNEDTPPQNDPAAPKGEPAPLPAEPSVSQPTAPTEAR